MLQLTSCRWFLNQNSDDLIPTTNKYHYISSGYHRSKTYYSRIQWILSYRCTWMLVSFSILCERIRHKICAFDQRMLFILYNAQIARMTTPKQMRAKLWHQRFGHPGPSQLSSASAHTFGMRTKLSPQFHPMHSCQVCSDAKFARMPN